MQLYNVILIYLLIGVILNYIFRINFSILSCGIFAWVGKDIKFFRKDLFNILGMYNDSRGGDACGLYYDDNWYKGIGADSKYEKLIVKHNLHNTLKLKKYPLIIGHDRKMSVGHTGIENAQPVVLVTYDTEELLYIHAHNGTISNFRDLAKKYKIDLAVGESDSIAMAKLLDTVGWDVLEEYEGTGAFVMHKKSEPDVLYAFHGRSKQTEYAVAIDERPLAFITFPGKGTYISSDIDHLRNLSIPDKEILPKEFKYNVLYQLQGDSVIELQEIDRSKINIKTSFGKPDVKLGGISKSPLSYGDETVKRAIRYYEGLFRLEDKPAHGVYKVDAWGWPVTHIKYDSEKHYELCFIYGILMRNRESFEKIIEVLRKEVILDAVEFYDSKNWNKIDAIQKLKACALFPFWRYDEEIRFPGFVRPTAWVNTFKNAGHYYFDGVFKPLFANEEYRIFSGEINSVMKFSYLHSITDFIKRRDYAYDVYDFSETTDEDLVDIKNKINGIDKKLIMIPPVIKLDNKKKIGCDKCNAWRSNPKLCESCISDNDHDMDAAYKEYEEQIGAQVIHDSFKVVLDSIDDSIDTYESIAIDLKDDEIEDVIDDFRKIQTKLTKY